jgi:DNA-binding NarL/FixJ family response regulator
MTTRISVLIADDTLIALEGIKSILKNVGEIESIATASTPQEVLDVAIQMRPDVVVLDMKWFGNPLTGLTLIKELRVSVPRVSIIAMTSYPELLKEAENAGAEYVMEKTFSRNELIQTIQMVKSASPRTVLFLAADPTDASRLRLGEELREIQEKLQLAKLRGRYELHQRLSVRPTDISQALLDIQPQIVHFSGHGSAMGALCFESQTGETHPIQPNALAALFEQFSNQVDCVVLNACYSEIQASAIAKHINFVIGMNQAIGDKAAIAFAIGFYQALGAGRTIDEAYKLGCVQIRLQNIPEHLTPVLICKGQAQS